MPNVLLPAPHFEQSRDGACLPACVRMVLAFYGDLRRESDIAAQLGWTAMLPGWVTTTSHVLVVVGYDEDGVFVNDPAFAEHPRFVTWAAFLASWAEFDETSVILTPRR